MGIQGAVERTSYGAGQANPSLVPHEKEGFLCAKHCAGHRRYVVSEADTLCLHKTYPPTEDTMEGQVSQHARQCTGWGGAAVLSKDGSTTSPSRMVFFKVARALRGGIYAPSSELEACDCFDQHSWVKVTLCDFQGRGEKATFALLAVTLVLGAWRLPTSKEAKPQRKVRASLPSSCPSLSVRCVREQALEQHRPPTIKPAPALGASPLRLQTWGAQTGRLCCNLVPILRQRPVSIMKHCFPAARFWSHLSYSHRNSRVYPPGKVGPLRHDKQVIM